MQVGAHQCDAHHVGQQENAEPSPQQKRRWEKLGSLYDVFVRIRDDEAAHWDTLTRLVHFENLDAAEGCEVAPLVGEGAAREWALEVQ